VLHGGDGGPHVGVPCEHNDGEVGIVGTQRFEGPDAVGVGEARSSSTTSGACSAASRRPSVAVDAPRAV
jgi:hypothetical protein